MIPGRRIGATDAGACVALYHPGMAHVAKWSNARDLYERLVHGVERKKTKAMERGHEVEPILRGIYEREVGAVLPRDYTSSLVIGHPEYDFATASPDDIAIAGDGTSVLVEYKSASVYSRPGWAEGVPDLYMLQIQHGMACCECSVAHLLAGFGEDTDSGFLMSETRVYQANPDPELQQMIFEAEFKFWYDHIIPGIPPDIEPVNNKRSIKSLYKGAANG